MRIFLSYRREDTAGHAGRLYDRLTAQPRIEHVFMDFDAIHPGDVFARTIEQALDDCDVFLALIGTSWSTATDPGGRRRLDDPADLVRAELEAALRRDIRVIPLLVQGAQLPAAGELPGTTSGLLSRQALELSNSRWHRDVAALIEQLLPPSPRRNPTAVIALAVAGVLLLAAAGALALTNGFGPGGRPDTASAGVLEPPVPVGVDPLGIEAGEGFVWTSNRSGTVTRIDPDDVTVVDIAVGGQPTDLTIGGGAVWVWNYANAVTRIDIATLQVSTPIFGAAGPITGIVFGDGYLWLTHGMDGTVSRVSAATGAADGPSIEVGTRLGGTDFGDHRLYVLDVDARALVALDGASGRVLGDPLPLDRPLGGLQVDAGVIYVGSTDGITRVDETSFVAENPIPFEDAGLFEVGGGSLWVSYPLENVVRRFDLRTFAPQGAPIDAVGKGLEQAVFSAGLLWATERPENRVVRIRPGPA